MEETPYMPYYPPAHQPDCLFPSSEVHESVSEARATMLAIVMCVCLGAMICLLILITFTTVDI
ncbi:hypothetical protein MTO96_033382, partial [Rhipicephalus appendiculatus]